LPEANMVIELSMPHAATSATSMHLEKRSHQCYSITDNVNGSAHPFGSPHVRS
jgi:hypothetical protein